MKKANLTGMPLSRREAFFIKGGLEYIEPADGGNVCTITTFTNGRRDTEILVSASGCPGISAQANAYCTNLVISTPVDRCYYNCGC
jgi:hypothetical protein